VHDQSARSEEALEIELSRPTPALVEILERAQGDFLVLGAGGKMGPTLCRMVYEASGRRVTAVSRFSDAAIRERLEAAGISTVEADLLRREDYARLPDTSNVFFMAGMKFGATGREDMTWAMNTYVPALVAERYGGSRIVVFSTGNVYPLVPVTEGGATETTPPAPVGEYAQSCLGRERVFRYFSERYGTPVVNVRLNYANEPRYGIIVDLAQRVLQGTPVDLTMGHVNLIWQRDANAYIASALTLASSPAETLNVAGPETVSLRYLAAIIGEEARHEPSLAGQEHPTALLSNAARCFELFGYPPTPLRTMVRRVVQWLVHGGRTLDKPTKFQVRDGRF
jgi:nucleoside-diphosphate-sugar epimerase